MDQQSCEIFWDSVNQPNQSLGASRPRRSHCKRTERREFQYLHKAEIWGYGVVWWNSWIPAKSNSGVYLHGLYEVQVYDSFGVEHPKYLDAGGIYERWINDKGEGGIPPSVNASRRPGSGSRSKSGFAGQSSTEPGRRFQMLRSFACFTTGSSSMENVEAPGTDPVRAGDSRGRDESADAAGRSWASGVPEYRSAADFVRFPGDEEGQQRKLNQAELSVDRPLPVSQPKEFQGII